MRPSTQARILEISNYPPPRAGWGVRISFVRHYLEARGHQCRVLNVGPSRKIKHPDYIDVQSGADFLRKVVRHARDGYTIHTHINGDSPKGLALALIAQIVGRILGRRSVLTFHAGPVQLYFPRERSGRLGPFFHLVFALADRVICNSDAVALGIREYGVPAGKIDAIPAFSRQYLDFQRSSLPGPLEEFLSRHRPVLVSYFFNRPEFDIGTALDGVAAAAQSLPELGLVLLGADTTDSAITGMLRDRDLLARTCQVGDLPHDEFMTVLSRSHIYVRTPKKDGVCSSVLEALSLGIPVVASENGTRPLGVVTYPAGDSGALATRLSESWTGYEALRKGLAVPEVRDTVAEEARLLLQIAL